MRSIAYRYRYTTKEKPLPMTLQRNQSDAATQRATQLSWGQMTGNQAPARCLRTEMTAPSQPSSAAKATIAADARQSGPLSWNTAP